MQGRSDSNDVCDAGWYVAGIAANRCDCITLIFMETNITKRWDAGTPHHPKSVALFKSLAEIDWTFGGDYFCWKSGGDGDNGEHFMYELDIYFESQEQGVPPPQ